MERAADKGIPANVLSTTEGGDNLRIEYADGTYDVANNVKFVEAFIRKVRLNTYLRFKVFIWDKSTGVYKFHKAM